MKPNAIKSFSVYGLFGTDDIHIPFDENIKILIGENGLGKTQVLNLFYYTLTRNFFRLGEFNFEKLVLEFDNIPAIVITKDRISHMVSSIYSDPMIKDIIEDIGYNQFEMLRNRYRNNRNSRRKLEFDIEYNNKLRKYPMGRLFRIIEENESKEATSLFDSCKHDIALGVNGSSILYFPTYRRVEEDLHMLGYEEDEFPSEDLIQFGMEDVQRRFNQIEITIDRYLKEGFSEITSEILSQLVKGFSEIDRSFLSSINQNDIDIILARVGTQLPDSDKIEIRNIVLNQDFKNPSLTYFLQKLVEIYEKQKELDDSVKVFRDVCNKYLVNKKIFYDESAIKIYVKSGRSNSEIALSKLSSGEKQIVSIFSKVYLSGEDKRFIMLFDEPELSLSMTWQKQLLPDVLNSKKCDFLLAVTHSPFIFENELDMYAIGLNEYVTSTQTINN